MSLLRSYRLSRDRSVTVANLVDELLRRNGDREVSIEAAGPFRLAELHTQICRFDAFLRRTVNLQPGQPVAIYRTNNTQYFHWFLAIIRAGGIAVPLNPMLSLGEIRRILASSGTDILVTDRAVFDRNIHHRDALPVRTWIQAETESESDSDGRPATLDGFLRVPGPHSDTETATGAPFPPAAIDPAATIAVFHTSGTSGFPKGAALSSRALLGGRASIVLAGLVLGPKDLAFIALPWSHIMAVSIALYGMMAGVRGCFLEHFEVAGALDLIERHSVTAIVGVPAMFARLVNSNPDPARLASVRLWLSASDHLPSEVRECMRQYGALLRLPGSRRIPPVLLNGYGMVELGGLAMMGIETSLLPGSGDLCFPVPPFKIRVAGEDGRPVRAGVTGECQIRRRGLAPHYWKDKGKDGDLLTSDGWLRTGDLATRNRLGFIRLVGRMKDVIKSGGYSVYVRELEEAILAHPAVARAAAFGLPHKDKGEIPAAAVELHNGSVVTESALLDFCRENLAPYKAPRRIWILDAAAFPHNHTGKLLRRELRERFTAEMQAE
ncbi:MAG: class I adenylate-forming enzyme family protein [Acidobacteriaceae bacterium]|jgi:acyl-CoA synthetase (AMP-forming)/AMP-acid ligase II